MASPPPPPPPPRRRLPARPSDWLRLVRAPLAPTAACDAVACALLARGPGLSRGAGAAPLVLPDALLLAATSLLVYAAGMAGNDAFDRERDRAIHPGRPVPSGRISAGAAFAAAAIAAAGALSLGGGPAGSRASVGPALASALFYDAYAKRFLVPGCLAMGLARAANAATGVLPLVLSGGASAWTLGAPLLIGLYSAGVTAHSTSEDDPPPASGAAAPEPRRSRLLFARAAAFVAFLAAGALSAAGAESVTAGVFFAPAVCLSIAFGRVPRRGPVEAQVRELLLGLYWIAAILAGGGFAGSRWPEALGAFGVAYALIVGSQLWMRVLRRRS